jgi:hypothetical protein
MTDTMTSQKIELSSWDILYKSEVLPLHKQTYLKNLLAKTWHFHFLQIGCNGYLLRLSETVLI